MGICAHELRLYVVKPTLRYLGMWSIAKENLLLGTAAAESSLGFHLKLEQHQRLGIYQISPKRHTLIWDNYLVNFSEMASKVRGLASQRGFLNNPHKELATNLSYATSIAWMIYLSRGLIIDESRAKDVQYLARLWCKYFHKTDIKTEEFFCNKYYEYITEEAQELD